ncbi:hypothetical protein CONCODRAFT_72748 [Conidiobolus coronatus NRRL 28638]|uniref:Uncharacterized protein n=1 Tax=Conidiobolus coronatus (strain ATCC 28846 / CBS 209.66 / NRRL 28638) TaxID=796925 RepID=A0A137NY70_CONC2|nr:hypothetical protein CONCODRAFT_72748 [Conidiobolus coronatus NRRL 28638]|eukprot:KXN67726.1 hypothetical protein CONCODRAFT_72748 [Conidiobolus coronatus NRRL 28638]
MSKCVWLQEFENLGLTQNPDDLSELNGLQTIKTTNFSTFLNFNNNTYKTSRTHKRISRGMSEISIMTAFTKAIPPPIIMDNTEGILKIRRCHLWMWRHNIEDNLRWIGEGLVTVEIRITFDKRPFLIMYSEKSNIWDDTFGTISFSSWLVPSTDIERGGDSRVFLLKKYCLEPITIDDTNRLVEALNSAKQSNPDNSNLLTITSHLFSLAKVRVFYFREHNWEPIGHCMIEIRRTTSDRNSFALLLDMTRREIFNEWILDNTQVVRMNATNIRLAFTGAQGLTQFLIRAKESEIDKLASEMQREVAVGNHTPNSQDQIANFVSCYGPGREHETPQFEDVCKLYTIREDESSWLSLGLGIIQVNHIVKSHDNNPQLRMFCVATNTHELIFNEVLSSPLGVHQDMNQGVIVFEKDGVQQQVGVQFKTAQQASHFIEVISRHLATGDEMEVDEPPIVKVTSYESYTSDPSPSLVSPAIENFAQLMDDSPSRTRCETPLSQRMMDTSECEASDSESQEDAGSSAYSLSSPTTEEKIDSIPEEDTRYTSQLDDTPELRDTLNKSWRKATNSFSKANSSNGNSKFNRQRTIKHVNEIFDFGPNN